MSKVMKPRTSIPAGYFNNMHSKGPPSSLSRKHPIFNRSVSMSESEIHNINGLSDYEEEKSEIIEDFMRDEDEREVELIHSDFDDEDEEEDRNDPFQRQLGYPPLPRYKTPMPPNPLDKLGTLTPMEEMTEPPSSGANTPASFIHKSKSMNNMSKKRGPSGPDYSRSPSRASINNLMIENDQSRSQSRGSSRNPGDNSRPSSSRNSPHLLTIDNHSRSRSQSRAGGHRPPSPSPSSRPDAMSDYPKSASRKNDFPLSSAATSRPASPLNRQGLPSSSLGALDPPMDSETNQFREALSSPDSMESYPTKRAGMNGRDPSGPRQSTKASRNQIMLTPLTGSCHSSGGEAAAPRSKSRHPSRTATPRPILDDDSDMPPTMAMDMAGTSGSVNDAFPQSDMRGILDKDYDSDELDKIVTYDRVRSWQRHSPGNGSPIYSAMADAEFSSALDGMITKLHGSKVDWEYRVKLADDLTAALKNVSPQVLLKNMSQIIPLVSNIAAESHFRVSLSILSTITTLGDRLRDCKAFLGPKSIQNADLTWLIRRLCTVCGESRSTLRSEGALALSHLIKGAGPELVCEPLFLILASDSKKNSVGRLTAGPRIKAAAIDALTFALLTFPRDEFDLPVLAKHVCKSLWNSKRRVRQASLECLAVVAHALGPSMALPLFRQYIEDTKMDLSSSSSSSGARRAAATYGSVATPTAAIAARVSRHLLPSPSPAGLVEYAVMIPQRGMGSSSYENLKTTKTGGLDPILTGNGSGKNRHSGSNSMVGADIAWILTGTGPTVSSTLYSPGSNLDWLAEETVTGGWPPSEGESSVGKGSGDRRYTKSKMRNSHSYNGAMDMLDSPLKPSWSSSGNSGGSYMDRYHKNPYGDGKPDKGFALLPNKYPNHSSSNGELPNLGSPYSHSVHSTFSDFNSNLWAQHEELMGYNNNMQSSKQSNGGLKNGSKHSRTPLQYTDTSSRRFDQFSQNNTSIEQSDSDHDPAAFGSHHQRPSYQHHGGGEGHFIKIQRDYEDMTDEGMAKKEGGLDSAGSSNTRDSGVSSLKSSKTIPSPPSMMPSYEGRGSGSKMSSSKKKTPSPSHMQNSMESGLSRSRSWRSTPDVPELANEELDSRKGNEIGSDLSRSQSGSSGFLHRKPVLARSSQRKASSDSIANRLSALELRDFDDGTESEATYTKEKIPNYHLSLSTTNIPHSEDEGDKSLGPYSGSSLRPSPAHGRKSPAPGAPGGGGGASLSQKPYMKSRSRSRTPVPPNHQAMSGMSSTKGDGESVTTIGENNSSSPSKNNISMLGKNKNTTSSSTLPKRVFKGSFRDSNGRHTTGANPQTTEVYPPDLKPVDSPRHSLSLALNNLNSSEWETNLDGFRLLVRLSRHHPDSLRNDLHNININGMRHLMNLRSTVCRAACLFFKELFLSQGKLMEQDVEKICEKLLDKTSDTNKFIREDSASAIETMVLHLTPAKVLTCLDTYGLKHRNPTVRTAASKMLLLLVRRLGSERSLFDHPEKILPMIMHFLQEGSLDTRTHAKHALAELISHKAFDSQLRRHVTPDTLRNVSKSIATIRSEMHRY